MKGVLRYWVKEGRSSRRMVTFSLKDEHNCNVDILRRQRLINIITQASNQGVRLRLVDLCLLLSTSRATVKRDLRELRQIGLRNS